MENMNTVNISLSEYNLLNNKLSNTQSLLNTAQANLSLLQDQQKTNKIVVVEKRESDGWSGTKVKSSVAFDVKDPEVSKELLKIMNDVDTSELSKTIEDQKNTIKNLNSSIDSIERSYRFSARKSEELSEEKLRKQKKTFEDSILDLEIDKETLTKALADLKVNKTKEQLEVVRQQEIVDLKEKIAALQEIKHKSETLGFFKFKSFIASVKNAEIFSKENVWVNKLWKATSNAMNELDTYVRLLAQVGKLPEKKQKDSCCKNNGPSYPTAYSGYNYVSW